MSVTLSEPTPLAPSVTRNIRTTTLPNGLLVITESMPHLRSISMGVWVKAGARDEAPAVNGISHFVEHMVFKGTTSRSAQQFAREVDTIGGNLDAFTSKENICFNIKVLDENMEPALDLLSDLVLHPTFTPEDIEREQGVILEEIKMDEDNPDYLVHEIFTQNLWKGHALGRPILGTAKTVSSFTQQIVFEDYRRRFTAGNLIFSAAGNLDHDRFVALVERFFGELAPSSDPLPIFPTPVAASHITLKNKKSLEQVQLCLGVPAPPVAAENRYVVYLLNTMLGGGMSSRLFQTIREQHGLAYSIYSEMSPFRDTGSLCIYAGTSTDNAPALLRLTLAELARFKQEAVSDAELRRAKEQLKSNMILGLESSSSRMSSLARQQMYFRRFFSLDDLIAEINRITPAAIQDLAQELFQTERMALALLGPLGEMKVARSELVC